MAVVALSGRAFVLDDSRCRGATTHIPPCEATAFSLVVTSLPAASGSRSTAATGPMRGTRPRTCRSRVRIALRVGGEPANSRSAHSSALSPTAIDLERNPRRLTRALPVDPLHGVRPSSLDAAVAACCCWRQLSRPLPAPAHQRPARLGPAVLVVRARPPDLACVDRRDGRGARRQLVHGTSPFSSSSSALGGRKADRTL